MKFPLLVVAASLVALAACQNEQTGSGLAASSSPGTSIHLAPQPAQTQGSSVTIKDANGATIFTSTAGGALSLTAKIVDGKVVISSAGGLSNQAASKPNEWCDGPGQPACPRGAKPDDGTCAPGQTCTGGGKAQGGNRPNEQCNTPGQSGCPNGGNPTE